MKTRIHLLVLANVVAITLALAMTIGCQQGAEAPIDAKATAEKGHKGHVHGAWWCDEHGVPEKVCALCDSKLAAEFQRKGDWCEKHERPDSQCFVCHPELEARFAAQYEAKYGKQPPKPQS